MTTEEKVKTDFEKLKSALEKTKLPHEHGGAHTGCPSEFMWMHEDKNGVHFKHVHSRNYVVLLPNGALFIPTGAPFLRGTFDRPEDLANDRPPRQGPKRSALFDPAQCGGAFDGVSVFSDADPGL